MTPTRSDASGFTLVELLVAMSISLIISGVLATSIVVGLRNADASGQRLFNSHDAQIAQSYFTTDVLSADLVDVEATDSSCAGAAGDVLLVRFHWSVRPADPTSSLTYQVAAWRTRIVGTERQLVRQLCSGTTSFAAAPVSSSVVLAHGLAASSPPTVTCTFATAPGSETSCATVSASKPFRTVRVTGTSTQTSSESTDSLVYVLKAARRSSQ